MSFDDLSPADIAALQEYGLAEADARRQLELLRRPPSPIRLLRPCTLGDGLLRLEEHDWGTLEAIAAEEAAGGAFAKFVPASGAATRMFGTLLRAWRDTPTLSWRQIGQRTEAGDPAATDVARLLRELDRFPFSEQLRAAAVDRGFDLSALRDDGAWHRIVTLLLTDDGLALATRPKALVPFHRADHESRTAFEEQIDEGRAYLLDAAGRERHHFTIAPGTRPQFERALRAIRSRHGSSGEGLIVDLSRQSASTSTLAVTAEGAILRSAAGLPVSRPGGHGALLPNLEQTEAELVFVRNIDNVLPPGEPRNESVRWRRRLAGLLVSVRNQARNLLEDLQAPGAGIAARTAARRFLSERFHTAGNEPADDAEADRRHLIALLDRPLRVCGMVPNTGEPGGGPFWIETAEGPSMQIVEKAQVDLEDDEQRAAWHASTHFNPVDLVCCLRNGRGEPYDLSAFTDPDAVIVAGKLVDGRPGRVLERPGLWNGGMAKWNSIFVEIPATVFAPVKTVFDLLRPEHQPTETAHRSDGQG